MAATWPSADRLRGIAAAAVEPALDYPYRLWGYGEGPGLLGVLAAARVLGRPELIDAVAGRLAAAGRADVPGGAPAQTDHLIPVELLHALRALRPAVEIGPATSRFVAAVAGAPHPVPGQPAVHRDQDRQWGRTIWVDCLHTDGPGLVLAGELDAAVRVVDEHAAALQDESGLFSHGYDVTAAAANGVHWARGQGWALHGLVGLLTGLPAATARPFADRLDRLLAALLGYEERGRWHTVVDDPASPYEISLSPMISHGVVSAVRAGVLDERWLPLAARALAATLDEVADGVLAVSAATPVGRADSYHEIPTGCFPWGQGPLLLAVCAAGQMSKTRS